VEGVTFKEAVSVARTVLDPTTPITSGHAETLARWVLAEDERRRALRLAMIYDPGGVEDE